MEFVVDVDAAGTVTECRVVAMDVPQDGPRHDPCGSQPAYYPATDAEGNPVPVRMRFRMELTREEVAE